jgi:hypothetical protein
MRPVQEFCAQRPEFWALVKLVSQEIGYSERGTGRIKRYEIGTIADVLRRRGLDPSGHDATLAQVVRYVERRAELLEASVMPNLMDRAEARQLFEEIRERVDPPPSLLPMNKQKAEKRHPMYLSCIVNMLTYAELTAIHGQANFDPNPRAPLTFAAGGMPLRTLFRWMDGAYPDVNHPHATWEIKEYYGTTTFGSRVADGVYETALDGYELNDLRALGIAVEHHLFVDDRFTWWDKGRSYLTRIVDMLHAGLLDGAFFGREVVSAWPAVVAGWPAQSPSE